MSVEAITEVVRSLENPALCEKEQLDLLRTELEPYIYLYLVEKYNSYLNTIWSSYYPPKVARYAYMIVERRAHPNFAIILKMMAWAAPYMSVYIFCSDENYEFIRILLGDKLSYFNIHIAFRGKASREEGKNGYNQLLTDARTYEMIDAEYLLTVQMDTIIRRKIPTTIFCGSYWGNPWGWQPNLPGGGGSTVRNVEFMISLCKRFHQNPTESLSEAEDIWICNKLIEMGGSVPDLEFRRQHIMENMPAQDPIILHQFWTFAKQYQYMPQEEFVKYWSHLLTLDIS